MQPVAARSRFVREHQPRRLRVQATNQFVEVGLPGSDGPGEDGWIGALAQGVRDGDRIFVDVETDKKRVGCAMADLRKNSAAVHATLRLWPAQANPRR